MTYDTASTQTGISPASLPAEARLPINRCNLPATILGGLTFQQHPVALTIDGVQELHKQLFQQLQNLASHEERAQRFMDYMVVQFRLHQLQDAGLEQNDKRGKADYLRLLRGWLFDPDSREGAVLKGWVESRFGLLPQYHGGPLQGQQGPYYQAYIAARAEGLYGTNALEAQLDLLYSYCQYELARQYEEQQRLELYRGVNGQTGYEVLAHAGDKEIVLLNNLNACSSNRERAGEFGDQVLQMKVPWQKVLYFSRLFPGRHIGEDEYLVIGGVYQVSRSYW